MIQEYICINTLTLSVLSDAYNIDVLVYKQTNLNLMIQPELVHGITISPNTDTLVC
jgi:hypothetical protein